MAILLTLLRYKHLLAYGSLAVIVAGLLVINNIRWLEIERCDMERAAIKSVTEQLRANAADAAKRLEQERVRRQRLTDRTMRDVNNAPDNRPISGPMRAALSGLCNMGASCQDTQ